MSKLKDLLLQITNNDTRATAYGFINIMCACVTLFECFLVDFFFNDKIAICITFGIALMFIVTMLDASRTGRFDACAIIMSVTYNMFFLPYLFFSFNRFSTSMPVLFVFGLVYTAISLQIKYAIILTVIETIFYAVCIAIGFNSFGIIKYDEGLKYRLVFYAYAPILIIVSFIIGIAIRYRSKQFFLKYLNLLKNKESVEQTKIAKDMFLTNMSHEIRTPMNAISGNINLLLEQDVSYHVRDNAYFVINAANAFLTVINELMEFSVEDIDDNVLEKYDFRKLLSEVSNLSSILLLEKRLDFCININPSIPCFLNGNNVRVKQIMFNTLHALMNSLDDGLLVLDVDYTAVSSERILVHIRFYGTGPMNCADELRTYIKNEDISHILSTSDLVSRIQLDKEIISIIGGAIKIDDLGNNRFAININYEQEVAEDEMIAHVANAASYNILCFEEGEHNIEHLKSLFKSLNVKSTFAKSRSDFEDKILNNKYSHIFIASEKYIETSRIITKYRSDEKVALITSFGESTGISDADTTIMRPINSIILYKVFNNEDIVEFGGRFKRKIRSLCNVRILVVDDNFTNLNVASAIFKNYGAEVYTASSGAEGIRILCDRDIDIIFLDYMMPEMNGIDTLNVIKDMEDKKFAGIPSVALSANVVGGVREMFSQAGFDAFVPKPIDIFVLENIFIDLLPEDKIVY